VLAGLIDRGAAVQVRQALLLPGRPGSGLPAGRHRHGPLSLAGAGMRTWQDGITGSLLRGSGLGGLICRQTARGSGRVVPSGLPVSPGGPSA
jgi:hypothetical protein